MAELLLFTADWCNSCTRQKEMLAEYDATPVEEIDVDEEVDRANRYNVRSLPTMVLVGEDGTPRETFIGTTSATKIKQAIADLNR